MPIKIPVALFFTEIGRQSKTDMESQKTPRSQKKKKNLEENRAGGTTLSDFKIY